MTIKEIKSIEITLGEDNVIVPRWFLESVEDTLRIQYNINQPDMKKLGRPVKTETYGSHLMGFTNF